MAQRNSPRPKNAPAPKGNAHGKAGLHAVSMSKAGKSASDVKSSSKYKASDFAGKGSGKYTVTKSAKGSSSADSKDGHWVTVNGQHRFIKDDK